MSDEVLREIERRLSDLEDVMTMMIGQPVELPQDPTGVCAFAAKVKARRGGTNAEN